MSLDVDRIEEDARAQTGLDDTGGDYYREGLDRLVASMNDEGDADRDRRGHAAHAPERHCWPPAWGWRRPTACIPRSTNR